MRRLIRNTFKIILTPVALAIFVLELAIFYIFKFYSWIQVDSDKRDVRLSIVNDIISKIKQDFKQWFAFK